jgi:hypothetical protein
MNDLTLKFAKLYSLQREDYYEELSNCSNEDLMLLVSDLLNLNLTDPNFSSLAESIPIDLGGYKKYDEKHGYDGYIGESYETADEYIEIKPEKTSSTSKKLSGAGGYADYTEKRLNEDKELAQKLKLGIPGFVNGKMIYFFKVPYTHAPFIEQIEKRTIDLISKGKRVLPTFGYNHYKDCEDIELVYLSDDIENFKEYMSKPFYDFLIKLK